MAEEFKRQEYDIVDIITRGQVDYISIIKKLLAEKNSISQIRAGIAHMRTPKNEEFTTRYADEIKRYEAEVSRINGGDFSINFNSRKLPEEVCKPKIYSPFLYEYAYLEAVYLHKSPDINGTMQKILCTDITKN